MSTFYDLIFAEKKDWDKELLITNIKSYSLTDIYSLVDKFINILKLEGDLKGKKVAILIPDLPVYFSLLIAINKLGGTCIPLSYQYRSEDLSNILNLTKPNFIFTVENYGKIQFKQILSDWAKNNYIKTILFTFHNEQVVKELIEGKDSQETSEGIDFIACTSGSTGVPKGVKLSVGSIERWTKIICSELVLKKSDRIFLTIPITSPYGIYWLLTCFKNRIQMVLSEVFDMPIVLNLLKNYSCNKIATTPSIFKGIYLFAKKINPMILNQFELGCLAGEKISSEFITLMRDFDNCRLINHYGLSEQGPLMFSNDIRSSRIEWSVCDGIEHQVMNMASDGIGEIAFKNPFGFEGYYLNEELTREALTKDGWFYTGDFVQINERGKFDIVGRKKQMIKKAGVQIMPGEVEQVISQHPKVIQAAVVGVPHSVYGEDIIAFIVMEDDDLNIDGLFSFIRERIASFKVPSKMIKINEMPIIQGKLDKVSLQKMALES